MRLQRKGKLSDWVIVTVIGGAFLLCYLVSILNFSMSLVFGLTSIVLGIVYGLTILVALVGLLFNPRKFKLELILANLLVVGVFSFVYLYRDGYFFGRKLLEAELVADLGREDLILWERQYKISTSNILSSSTYYGTYEMKGDTIKLDTNPFPEFPSKLIIENRKVYKGEVIESLSPEYSYNYFIVTYKK